ncbi:MAG: cytochrome c3 family protein [Planctomycetota bacterium]
MYTHRKPPVLGLALVPALLVILGNVATRAPEPVAPVVKQMDCITSECHADMGKKLFVHGPVRVKKCRICHKQPDPEMHDFTPTKKGAAACLGCHEMELRQHVHAPVAEGQCLQCHDPHESTRRFQLRARSQKALCAECHDTSRSLTKKFPHGPVVAGKCTLCHDPHSSYHPRLLNSRASFLCLTCHSGVEQKLKESTHWHQPVNENCALCHDAHGSDHRHQLKDEAQAQCLDCHEAKRSEIESATVYHEALMREDGCSNCHQSHASRFPKLLDQPVNEICARCHDKPQKRPDGTVVAPISKTVGESKFLHGPIRTGDCTSCHNSHGAKTFRMLRGEYPQSFYAPFDVRLYTLCFACHDARAFTTERTTTLTDFRHGDRNLHLLHVNKETKGRTCRACHRTHASNRPMHMAEKVPFGGWEITLNFRITPSGGSCAPGCHKPETYDHNISPKRSK